MGVRYGTLLCIHGWGRASLKAMGGDRFCLGLGSRWEIFVLLDEAVPVFELAAIGTYLSDQYLENGGASSLDCPSCVHYYQWLNACSSLLRFPTFVGLIFQRLAQRLRLPYLRVSVWHKGYGYCT